MEPSLKLIPSYFSCAVLLYQNIAGYIGFHYLNERLRRLSTESP
jgi:hypothetical protein